MVKKAFKITLFLFFLGISWVQNKKIWSYIVVRKGELFMSKDEAIKLIMKIYNVERVVACELYQKYREANKLYTLELSRINNQKEKYE